MRAAIIADLHGNLISLERVLDDIDQFEVDQVVCLGDVAGLGPRPVEVVELLQSLNCPVVMGNADEFMIDPGRLDPALHPHADEMTRRLHEMEGWAAAQLTDRHRAYIRTFRHTVEVVLDEGITLLCYHGSPHSAWDDIRSSTTDEDLARKLGEPRHALMAGGHTHQQFVRTLDETIVLNPGSVGLPFETVRGDGYRNPPRAEYALVHLQDGRLDIQLRRLPVDVAAVREALLETDMPHRELWAADWR